MTLEHGFPHHDLDLIVQIDRASAGRQAFDERCLADVRDRVRGAKDRELLGRFHEPEAVEQVRRRNESHAGHRGAQCLERADRQRGVLVPDTRSLQTPLLDRAGDEANQRGQRRDGSAGVGLSPMSQ